MAIAFTLEALAIFLLIRSRPTRSCSWSSARSPSSAGADLLADALRFAANFFGASTDAKLRVLYTAKGPPPCWSDRQRARGRARHRFPRRQSCLRSAGLAVFAHVHRPYGPALNLTRKMHDSLFYHRPLHRRLCIFLTVVPAAWSVGEVHSAALGWAGVFAVAIVFDLSRRRSRSSSSGG